VTLAIVIACMALVLLIGVNRGRSGRAVTDIVVLVMIFGIIAIVDLVLRQFIDTRNAGETVAVVIAGAFAFDALYGLMAPERQRRRDRRLRQLMRRRRA
jgi:hypothetical protein